MEQQSESGSGRTPEQQEMVANFSGITGEENLEQAAVWLEAMGWDLEKAVNMFLEGGAPPTAGSGAGAGTSANARAMGNVTDDTDWEQLQRIVDENEGPAPDMSADDVRAADQAYHDQLIGGARYPGGRRPVVGETIGQNDIAIGINAILGAGLLPGLGPSPPIPGGPNLGPIMQPDVEPLDPRWLFPPPKDINTSGPFDHIRSMAKEQKKWLLVNIQDVNVFQSHELNRDTWTNDTVRSMIDAGFIFWLRDNQHMHARTYIDRYHINEDLLPHVAIIDPRTAGKVEEHHGFIDPDRMSTILMEFLENHSFDSTQVKGRSPGKGSPALVPRKQLDKSQIDAIPDLQASKQTNSSIAKEEDDLAEMKLNSEDSNSNSIPADPRDEKQKAPDDNNNDEKEQETNKEEEDIILADEPAADAENVTTIQMRLADGKRAQRRFLLTDKVGILFSWAKLEVSEARFQAFDIMNTFPSKSLKMDADKSLGEAGLSKASVRMRWL